MYLLPVLFRILDISVFASGLSFLPFLVYSPVDRSATIRAVSTPAVKYAFELVPTGALYIDAEEL
jgi:hypothetical protein